MASSIDIVSLDLSMTNPTGTGKLQANLYQIDGVVNADGTPRNLSIGQLVMAVCLQRATELEDAIVAQMAAMAVTTDELDRFSKVEADLAAWQKANPNSGINLGVIDTLATSYPNLYAEFHDNDKRMQYLRDIGMSDPTASYWSAEQIDEIMQKTEEKMDSLNTISQEQLIDIQSLTSKRDDTYSMISNVLKSLYTVMTGNVNNL